jgi:hypothetical protein
MKHTKAITLAIAALEAQIKRLAVNANLADMCHADAPVCVEASKRRTELREAIAALKEPVQARMRL